VSDQEVEDFLEHVGVKGMKWGTRKSSSDKNNNQGSKSSTKPPLTAKQKKEKDRKKQEIFNKVLSAGVATVYAAMFISSILVSAENQKFKDQNARNQNSRNQKTNITRPPKPKSAADIINDRRNVEVSSLKRMHREGKMDADQLKNFSTILNARYDRKVDAAKKSS